MSKFDLQLFTEIEEKQEAAVEIPAELSDLSPEIAAEIMKEAAALDEPEEKEPEETPEKEEAENEGEQNSGQPETPEKEPEEEAEKKRLQERLAELETGQQQQIPKEQKESSNQSPAEYMKTQEFVTAVNNEARRRAQKELGYTDTQIEEFESGYAEDSQEKRTWANAVQSQVSLVSIEAHEGITQHNKVMAENQRIHQEAYGEYVKLAEKIGELPNDDRQKLWAFTTGPYMQAMSTTDQYALSMAYRNAESGQGSPQDIAYVKYHLTQAMEQFNKPKQTPQDAANSNKAKKIEQMKAHPRTDQLTSEGEEAKGLTIKDIEKMLNDPNVSFDQIPAEWRKKLLV